MPSRTVKARRLLPIRSAASVRRSTRVVDRAPGARVGWLLPESRPDHLLVDFAGNQRRGALWARTTVLLPAAEWRAAAAGRHPVLLLTDADDSARPIIVGFVHEDGDAARGLPAFEARVDGLAVTLEGRRQIELRCGKASLVLTRDGRIILSGVDVDTRASGTNRVRGGIVKIN